MKRERTILALALALCCLHAWAWKPLFVGHRGCLRGVENTVEAFRNGVDYYGYDGLECDVRVTSDGYYVISHDETTTRLGGNLTVASATLAELLAEDYTQTRNGITYTGKICTVEEYLDICVEKNVFPIIELKWTTGINNGDMSKFPGLAQMVIDKGLADKAIFLTSMKQSLEYVRANYPSFNCQWLCASNWSGSEGWCRQNHFTPSIQSGCFDINTVNRFRRMGLQVAMWTVDTQSGYEKYGNMGVAMMTCNSLMPSDMPELDSINWSTVDSIPDPLPLKCDTIFCYSRGQGNLPQAFPSRAKKESIYNTAMQAAVIDGVFYTNDYETTTLLALDNRGRVRTVLEGTTSSGIAADRAGNLIMLNDGQGSEPRRFRIYPHGNPEPVDVEFTLLNEGETRFISASGNVMGEEGGYVFFYSKGHNVVNVVHLANGQYLETTASQPLSATANYASLVYPIGNDPGEFLYQMRTQGIYYYHDADMGEIVTGSSGNYAPNRNTSVGIAQLQVAGHRLVVHPSGVNYNGGFTIRDISSDSIDVLNIDPLGNGSLAANLATGQFFAVDSLDENHSILYEYCMGNGYVAYQLYIGDPLPVPLTGDVNADGHLNVSDVTALINMILGITPVRVERADIDHNWRVNVSDITQLVNILLGIV